MSQIQHFHDYIFEDHWILLSNWCKPKFCQWNFEDQNFVDSPAKTSKITSLEILYVYSIRSCYKFLQLVMQSCMLYSYLCIYSCMLLNNSQNTCHSFGLALLSSYKTDWHISDKLIVQLLYHQLHVHNHDIYLQVVDGDYSTLCIHCASMEPQFGDVWN